MEEAKRSVRFQPAAITPQLKDNNMRKPQKVSLKNPNKRHSDFNPTTNSAIINYSNIHNRFKAPPA